MKFHGEIWPRKRAIFYTCLVNIFVQTHDIDLKILPVTSHQHQQMVKISRL